MPDICSNAVGQLDLAIRGALSNALVAFAVELVRWIDNESGKDRARAGWVRLRTNPAAYPKSLLPFARESVEMAVIVHTDSWAGPPISRGKSR